MNGLQRRARKRRIVTPRYGTQSFQILHQIELTFERTQRPVPVNIAAPTCDYGFINRLVAMGVLVRNELGVLPVWARVVTGSNSSCKTNSQEQPLTIEPSCETV